jgi:predicted secreted protein
MNRLPAAILALCLAAGAAAHAAEPRGAKVNLDARAMKEVDNDVMRAVMFTEMEDADPVKLADAVNKAMNDALKAAKQFPGLRVKSSGYSSYPMTEKSRIVRWRSRSELSLEGEDFRLMADAIGKLQASLQLGSVEFSVSPASRAKAEDALTREAIAEFLRKADIAAKSFRGKTFSVIEASVSSDGGQMPPPRPMVMMKSMASDASVAAPAMEAGTSRITVNVNGAILVPR